MGIENFFGYEINRTLCDLPRSNFGYYKANSDIQRYIIEYVFGTSKIILPGTSSKGPFGLMSFKALAESENFANLVKKDKRILSLAKEIKDIYLEKIINQKRITSTDLLENHMKPLVRILFDPYLSPDEFYKRAKVLKENLLYENRTSVSEYDLFPRYHAEQEQIYHRRNRSNMVYNTYRMAA